MLALNIPFICNLETSLLRLQVEWPTLTMPSATAWRRP